MRKTFAIFALLLSATKLLAADAQSILAASDAVRNPGHAFSVNNTLTEYRGGKQVATSTLLIYSKVEEKSGQFRNLIQFVAPLRDANKLMLKTGNELWFYDPASKATVRISPQQRLLGQAANGDILTVNFARDYTASHVAEEEVLDGGKRTRRCHKLALRANTADVTYPKIEMWIDAVSNHPVKAKFYAESGRLLKSAYYRHYRDALGTERPSETVIIDGLDTAWVTLMRFSGYAKREVPDTWLQRDYLPRFRSE
jgi:outer membrane lipoprotein-sorting protein